MASRFQRDTAAFRIATPDPAASTYAFRQALESYPELPYFEHVGEIDARQPWHYPEHTHRNHEILLVMAGRVRYWIDGRDYTAGPGDLYFILPDQRHREESVDRRLRFFYLKFALWNAAGPRGRLVSAAPPGGQRLRDRQGRFAAMFAEIFREVTRQRPGSFEIVNSLILQMVWRLRRALGVDLPAPRAKPVPPRHREAIRTVRHYLSGNLARQVSLEELGKCCGMAPDYLWHVFKDAEGTTPLQYAQELRMAEAARRLRETDETVYQIADGVGYRDAGYFARQFKARTGFTPRAFRLRRGAALPVPPR